MALRRLSTSSLTNPKWYRDGSAGLGPYTDFELIDETVLTTSAASVTFSNLGDYSTIYKHLQIRAVGRSTLSGNLRGIKLICNGVTSASYSTHGIYGNGTSVSSFASASTVSMFAGILAGTSSPANNFGASVIDIIDPYSSSKNKTIRTFYGTAANEVGLHSGLFINTASITSISLSPDGGDFAQSSSFSLFGIKGA